MKRRNFIASALAAAAAPVVAPLAAVVPVESSFVYFTVVGPRVRTVEIWKTERLLGESPGCRRFISRRHYKPGGWEEYAT